MTATVLPLNRASDGAVCIERSTDDAPFCWQSKVALRKIREAFDSEKTVATALAVYLALTEIASDTQAETFQTTNAYIAQKSGLVTSTVKCRLKGLAEIGLVAIEENQWPGSSLQAPSTYRLLPVQQTPIDTASRLSAPASRLSAVASRRGKNQPSATLEEYNEESKEKRRTSFPPNLDEVLAAATEAGLTEIEARKFFYHYESKGWLVGKSKMTSWKAALEGWKLRWSEQPKRKATGLENTCL